jgi:type II secretory pathway component GspD/PulD (secretin)
MTPDTLSSPNKFLLLAIRLKLVDLTLLAELIKLLLGLVILVLASVAIPVNDIQNYTSKIENWEIMNYLQGVLLNVKVRVNNQNDIFLQVTPMITDILAEKETEDKKITAPIIMMRQATTILKLHNNDIAILGGLKGKRVTRDESGVPYLMNLKGIGNLARSKKLEIEDTEIVMIIRARLVY